MALDIIDRGDGNRVVTSRKADGLKGKIAFEGRSSSVVIGEGCVSSGLDLQIGSNVAIQIGERCRLGNLQVYAAGRNTVTIGERTSFNGRVRLLLHEAGAIRIGAGCLIGAHSDFMISDMHSILEAATGVRINPAEDIALADHVWLGERALILKGVRIGRDSVVGAASVVTKDVPAGSIVAGNPARVIRSGVTWRFDLI